MQHKTLFRLAAAAALTLGLSACAGSYGGGSYGRMAYNSNYDRYYGDPLGYGAVPYGYAGNNFGWSGNYYYPGTGNIVIDRAGRQRQWSRSQQRYWQNRVQRQQQMQRQQQRQDQRQDRRDDRRRR